MRRPQRPGSAFRDKLPPEPTTKDIEAVLINSGLLGKDPGQHAISYAKPLPDYKLPPEILMPSPYAGTPRSQGSRPNTTTSRKQSSRPNTATPRAPPSARRRKSRTADGARTVLREREPVFGPHIFYGKVLDQSEPPSPANFIQLNEILDRLVEEQKMSEDKIFYNIFGEIIQQYLTECEAQGSLLSDCRDCFTNAKSEIPEIAKAYGAILGQQDEEFTAHQRAISDLRPLLKQLAEKGKRMEGITRDTRDELATLVNFHDKLHKDVDHSTRSLHEMRSKFDQIEERLARKTAKLVDLEEHIRSLTGISGSYNTEAIRFADNLREMEEFREDGKLSIQKAAVTIDSVRNGIRAFDKEIAELTDALEKARIVPECGNHGTQVDLVSRKLFRPNDPNQLDLGAASAANDELFKRVMEQYGSETRQSNVRDDQIRVRTYDDLEALKTILFAEDDEFRVPPWLIEDVTNGVFDILDSRHKEFFELFAHSMMSDIMNKALSSPPMQNVSVQFFDSHNEAKVGKSLFEQLAARSRFIRLIGLDYSSRRPRQFNWIVDVVREIYDSKAIADDLAFRNGKPYRRLPEYIIELAKGKYGVDFICAQFCWDVHLTAHKHQNRSDEIDIFIDFLDERYTLEQLSFFLLCRSECLQYGSCISVRTRDNMEGTTEYYLSLDQVKALLPNWWKGHYKASFLPAIMELSVPRPAVFLESSQRYVAMSDILRKNIELYGEDCRDRLESLLIHFRVKPGLDPKATAKFLKRLLPTLSAQRIDDLRQVAITKGVGRTNVTRKEFAKRYRRGSVLEEREVCPSRAGLAVTGVLDSWNLLREDLWSILTFWKKYLALQPDDLTLKGFVDEATRCEANLKQSLRFDNGDVSVLQFYKYLFALDMLFSCFPPILEEAPENQETLVSMEYSIQENWFDHVY
jgi:hypothetical protein